MATTLKVIMLIATFVLFASNVHADRETTVFENSGWPGELGPVVEVGPGAIVRASPNANSRKLYVHDKAAFRYSPYENRYRCLRPGIRVATRVLELAVVNSDSHETETLKMQPGDQLEVLKYVGEGGYLFRHAGTIYDATFDTSSAVQLGSDLRSQSETKWEIWFKLPAATRTSGWVLYDRKTVDVVDFHG